MTDQAPFLTADSHLAASRAEAGWWVEETAVSDGEHLRVVWLCRPTPTSATTARPAVS